MSIIRAGLGAFVFTLTALCFASTGAHAQTFNFKVCNTSNVSASVAVSNLSAVGSSTFEVQGWWTVPAGNCNTIGTFPQGWFYVYAEQTNSGDIVWDGDFALCVEFPGPFDRLNKAGYSCSGDELKQFTAEQIPSTTGTFTWTLH